MTATPVGTRKQKTSGGAPSAKNRLDRRPSAADATDRSSQAIRTINDQLGGPLLDVYRTLLPNLRSMTYSDILSSPELVQGCMKVFEKQRDLFVDLLKNENDLPVSDDDELLWCGRSVDEVRVLVIRTTAKKYFRTHGDRFGDVKEHSKQPNSKVNAPLLERLFDLVTRLWHPTTHRAAPPPQPKPKSGADTFYEEIAPYLRYPWQLPLIPYYAALPRLLVRDVGEGLLTMRRPEDLEFVLRVGRDNFNDAQRITGDLAREMLDTDPRASAGVSHAGRAEYERLLAGLHNHMGARFWKVFTGTELLGSLRNKSTADIVEMATHLDRMSPDTVDSLVGFLQRPQIAPFLRVAETVMQQKNFDAVFGIPGNPRLARIFAKKAAQLRLDRGDSDDFEKRLHFIFQAYLASPEGFAKSL